MYISYHVIVSILASSVYIYMIPIFHAALSIFVLLFNNPFFSGLENSSALYSYSVANESLPMQSCAV